MSTLDLTTESDTTSCTDSITDVTNVVPIVESKATDEYEMNETSESISYNTLIHNIEMAWQEQYEYSGWPCDVYSDFVIVHMRKDYWKVPYETTDGKIVFASNDKWTKVEKVSEWVSKSINPYAIKALGEDRIGAYGILWGDESNKDLHGEFFTKDTEELSVMLDQLGGLPFMYHHAADGKLKSTVIGIVDKLESDDVGQWFEARIKDHEAYRKYVKPLIDRQALFPSSGTLPAAKRTKKNGEITRWPIIEMTGTPTPAEYRMLNVPIEEVKSYYKSIGLEFAYHDENDDTEYEATRKTTGNEKLRLEASIRQRRLNLNLMALKFGIDLEK
jgi:hypothetical protein